MKIPRSITIVLVLLLTSSVSMLPGQGALPQTQQETEGLTTGDSAQIQPFETTAITDAFNQGNSLISSSLTLNIS